MSCEPPHVDALDHGVRGGRCRTFAILSALFATALPASVSIGGQAWNADGSGAWDPSVLPYAMSADATDPQLVFDAAGNAVATWLHYGGTDDDGGTDRWNLWSAAFEPGKGWTGPALVDRISADVDSPYQTTYPYGGYLRRESNSPGLAMGPNGTAMATWSQYVPYDRVRVFASRFVPGAGWGMPATLNPTAGYDAVSPTIRLDAGGGAVAVWKGASGLYGAVYTGGGGWGNESHFFTGYSVWDFEVVLDPGGNATVVAAALNGPLFQIWSVRYVPSGGWTDAGWLTSNSVSGAERPNVAAGPAGTAVAVYHSGGLASRTFSPGSGWGAQESVDSPPQFYGDCYGGCSLVNDGLGNVTVVFHGYNGTGNWSTWAARRSVGGAWGSRTPLGPADYGGQPGLTADASGRLLAIAMMQNDSAWDVWHTRYVPGLRWGDGQILDPAVSASATPRASFEPNGDAWAVWAPGRTASNPRGNLTVRHFRADAMAPALNVSAPVDGSQFNVTQVPVVGTTEPAAILTIGGAHVDVAPNGSFNVTIGLVVGRNTVPIVAVDAAGNSASVVLVFNVTDPLVALRAQLSSTSAALNATLAAQSSAQNELNRTVAGIASTASALSSAWADYNVTVRATADAQASTAALRSALENATALLGQASADANAAAAALVEANDTLLQAGLWLSNANQTLLVLGGQIAPYDAQVAALGKTAAQLGANLTGAGALLNATLERVAAAREAVNASLAAQSAANATLAGATADEHAAQERVASARGLAQLATAFMVGGLVAGAAIAGLAFRKRRGRRGRPAEPTPMPPAQPAGGTQAGTAVEIEIR